jgi:hypothetical protein
MDPASGNHLQDLYQVIKPLSEISFAELKFLILFGLMKFRIPVKLLLKQWHCSVQYLQLHRVTSLLR